MSTSVAPREVAADLVEATPLARGIGYWLLASPLLIFIAWAWIDLFEFFSPIPWYWVDFVLGLAVFALVVVLPLGVLAHYIVTSLPGMFQHTGWDVQPLEPLAENEQYTVRFVPQRRRRAPTTWRRLWLRAAQGWVYLEVFAILAGAILAIPLFFSMTDFGFGK